MPHMTDFDQRLKDTLSHTYDIDRELGGAGMSRVCVATEKSLGRKVVIKVLSPELTADVSRSRFRREIQVAARMFGRHDWRGGLSSSPRKNRVIRHFDRVGTLRDVPLTPVC